MQIRTLTALLVSATLGATLVGCQKSDMESSQPQSRTDTGTMQGTAPAAPTQGRDSTAIPGATPNENFAAGKESSPITTAPTQSPDKDSSMASPSDESTRSNATAKQQGSS